MGYLKKVEGEALSRTAPTDQPTSVARKPKRRAEPDLRRKPPAPTPQADIHAAPGRQHHPKGYALHLRYAADNNRESRGKI